MADDSHTEFLKNANISVRMKIFAQNSTQRCNTTPTKANNSNAVFSLHVVENVSDDYNF